MNAIERKLRRYADAAYARDRGAPLRRPHGQLVPAVSTVARSLAARVAVAECEHGKGSGPAVLAAQTGAHWLQRVMGRDLANGRYRQCVAAPRDPRDLAADYMDAAVAAIVERMAADLAARLMAEWMADNERPRGISARS